MFLQAASETGQGVPSALIALRSSPITVLCLGICMALPVVCAGQTWNGVRWGDTQREWGAAVNLQRIIPGSLDESPDLRLVGPFDLWNGDWWRIPCNAFHHVGFLHLVFNGYSAWFLGKRLERHWGSWRYAVFLLPALFIPLLAEFLIGHIAFGFSGGICAMLGALIAIRQFRNETILSALEVQCGLAFLVFCVWVTIVDLANIANVAHLVGLAYGWTAAWCMCGPLRLPVLCRSIFILTHVLLLPMTLATIQPTGSGRYNWYLADRLTDPLHQEQTLRLAVKCDPTLAGVWLRLGDGQLLMNDTPVAWRTFLEGLSFNPSHDKLLEGTGRVWRRLPLGESRIDAERELRRVFGDQADGWLNQIRHLSLNPRTGANVSHWQPWREPDSPHFPLDQTIDLQWEPFHSGEDLPREFDPIWREDAVEGTTL
ncbi:MAG: rhomboid family intramembrane serine protease [Planctomycetales bacterium]|nr:rhomboid family intramembrane serine protease [Planctomycetales bacterium]